jgi:hypothetical protein
MQFEEALMRRMVGMAALVALGAGLWPVVAGATSTVTVDGHYRVTSTDCYFSGGRCTTTFDIEQVGLKLRDTTDKYFFGNVRGTHVGFGEVFPLGTVEDGWWCHGTTTDGGLTIRGTMDDGIGGSGTFVARFISS